MTLTTADRELLRDAAATLDGYVLALRRTSTVPPKSTNHAGDALAQTMAAREKALVTKLYALAERDETPSAVTP